VWLKWKAAQVIGRQVEIRELLKKKRGPQATIWTYHSNATYPVMYYQNSLEQSGLSKYADVIGIEVEPEGKPRLYTYYWRNNAAEFQMLKAQAAEREKVVWGLFYSTFLHDYTWNSILSWALGIKQWWPVHDPNAEVAWKPMVAWETRHEELLARWTPAANIGVVYSDLTHNHHPLNAGSSEHAFAYVNFCNALTDSHIVYRVVLDRDLDAGRLDRLDTLVLPHVALMTDSAAETVRKFVQNGGTVIATGETSYYRETSRHRDDFALADVFGVRSENYLPSGKCDVDLTQWPGFAGSRAVGQMTYLKDWCEVKVTDPKAELWASLTDSRGKKHPAVVARAAGKGRCIYFAFRPEMMYATQHLSFGAPLIEPGSPWEDKRDSTARALIAHAVLSAARPIVQVDNITRGIFVDAHRQRSSDVDNTIVTLANFLGAELTTGDVPRNLDPVFPEVAPRLPQPANPSPSASEHRKPRRSIWSARITRTPRD